MLFKKQHRSSDTAKMWWRAVRMHWYSHPLILKSLHLTFINASLHREVQRFCMSNEYCLFSLRFVMCLLNNRSIDTFNTCPLFQFFRVGAVFIKGNYWYNFLQRPFFQAYCKNDVKLFWNDMLSVKCLSLFQLTDILTIFNYCIKLNCIKWKALKLLLEVWLIIFNKYMNAASIRIAFIGLF